MHRNNFDVYAGALTIELSPDLLSATYPCLAGLGGHEVRAGRPLGARALRDGDRGRAGKGDARKAHRVRRRPRGASGCACSVPPRSDQPLFSGDRGERLGPLRVAGALTSDAQPEERETNRLRKLPWGSAPPSPNSHQQGHPCWQSPRCPSPAEPAGVNATAHSFPIKEAPTPRRPADAPGDRPTQPARRFQTREPRAREAVRHGRLRRLRDPQHATRLGALPASQILRSVRGGAGRDIQA